MKNPYKRTDVFTCHEQSHAKFENRVSVYHVMHVKKCYPHGCCYYKWHCALLNKGKSCIRRFHHVGRLCEGCSYFGDSKIYYQPRVILSALEFDRFKSELEEFEDWLAVVQDKDINFWGKVETIKPHFKKYILPDGVHVKLDGYIVIFSHGYIHSTVFDDVFYGTISPQQQERFVIAPADTFAAIGKMTLNNGRLVFARMWSLDFDERSHAETWRNSQALVARQTAVEFSNQPDSCLHCPKGALVDVVNKRQHQAPHRALYCLEGIQNPELCYIHAQRKNFHSFVCKRM